MGWDRWQQLSPEQRKKVPPLCPDFVIELRSENDALEPLQQKMQEYINNGLRLGWLINPQNRQVEVYRINQAKQVFNNPQQVDGEEVLPGFIFRFVCALGKSRRGGAIMAMPKICVSLSDRSPIVPFSHKIGNC